MPFWLSSVVLIATFQPLPMAWPWDGAYQVAMMLLVYPLLILCAQESEPAGTWGKIAKASAYLSYPVYALHYPVLEFFDVVQVHLGLPRTALLALATGSSLLVSYVVARYYEGPLRVWLGRHFSARTAAAGGTTS